MTGVMDRLARAGVAHGGREHATPSSRSGLKYLADERVDRLTMRTEAVMSPFLVSPTSGWIRRPSQISWAHLQTYSWARWIGLRVWKATMRSSSPLLELGAGLSGREALAHRNASGPFGSTQSVSASTGPAMQ
jgi:hypothetical protein